ncbi:hypothetical protein JJE68_01481 [Pediococcus acidilactici]|nr:hypothetical protein [Pediococcus acidilactici]QZQ47990.1 hypothetical protein JJE68_01481 [Pediococcus acidilactici]
MIINDPNMREYLEVQLIGHENNKIKARTRTGEYIFVYPTARQARDPLF